MVFQQILTLFMTTVGKIVNTMDNIIIYNDISLLSILVGVFIAHFAITLLYGMYGTFTPNFGGVKSDSSIQDEKPTYQHDNIMNKYRGF